MTTDFAEAMVERTDKQLAEILTIKRKDYQTEAVIAAELEFTKRGLDISMFVTGEDIKKSEELSQPIDPAKENLHWYFKILTLGLPNIFFVICKAIYPDSPPMIYSYIPISIIAQFLIHYKLQQKGLTKIAIDFKDWSYYGWIIRILLFILGYIFSTIVSA